VLLAAASAVAEVDGPYVSLYASGTWQDNVTNAPSGDGTLSAFSLESGADVSWLYSVDFSTILTSTLSATADVCTEFSGLDNLSVGPRLELRRKLGVGPFVPVVHVGLEGGCVGFSDPERSGIDGALVFGVSQRFSSSLQLLLDGRLDTYDARDIVFTGNYASLSSTLNWDVDPTWRIKLLGGWRNGDTVANYAAEESPSGWVAIDSNTDYLPGAWHYVSTFHDPFVAYRVSAQTWSYGAGVSPAIGPHTSLALQFVHCSTIGLAAYNNNIVSLSIIHRL
jgi:hypothetical protein